MHRRAYLTALSAGAAALTAGCVGAQVPSTTARTPPAGAADVDLPVPEDEFVRAIYSAIPAIVEPAFARDWSGVELEAGGTTYEPRLDASAPVIGVERHAVARAYPLGVLERHEVVNDTLPTGATAADHEPLLVTYCPSCGSSMTAIRRVRGGAARFEVSHLLWRSNLVLRDTATGSLWSQLLALAIRGPATGERLTLVPSTLERWGTWREAHPDTRVLLPPPYSRALYDVSGDRYEYDRYTATTPIIGEGTDPTGTGRTLVVGVRAGGEATAYPFEAVQDAGVVDDVVGETPVVVAVGPGGTLVAYDRRVDGETLRFRRADERTMAAGGSSWLTDRGVALDGPHEGVQLHRANDLPPLFRFAWEDFHPATTVYGEDG